ncbi:unnamed protein product [Phytomonas sp. Hart1]|nr:unnamed protein product [Phytomonas sp. Hart1]|eukprot:CCW72258.1 unnamed protein product [Phytomonas sp. isolate Hart1]
MSSLFDSYEEDYQRCIGLLTDTMSELKNSISKQKAHESDPTVIYHPQPSTGTKSRSHQLREVLQILAHVKDLLTSMNYEVSDVKNQYQHVNIKGLIANYQKRVVSLEEEASWLRQACADAERKDLLWFEGSNPHAGLWDKIDPEANSQRLMSLQTTGTLHSGTSTLLKAEAYLEQSKISGCASLNMLRAQTEQIGNIGNLATDVDAEIFASRRIINQMQSVAFRRKLFLSMVIAILVLFLILSVIYR